MPVGHKQMSMLADDFVMTLFIHVRCRAQLLLADTVGSLQVIQHVFHVMCHASWSGAFVSSSSLDRVQVRLHYHKMQ